MSTLFRLIILQAGAKVMDTEAGATAMVAVDTVTEAAVMDTEPDIMADTVMAGAMDMEPDIMEATRRVVTRVGMEVATTADGAKTIMVERRRVPKRRKGREKDGRAVTGNKK